MVETAAGAAAVPEDDVWEDVEVSAYVDTDEGTALEDGSDGTIINNVFIYPWKGFLCCSIICIMMPLELFVLEHESSILFTTSAKIAFLYFLSGGWQVPFAQ